MRSAGLSLRFVGTACCNKCRIALSQDRCAEGDVISPMILTRCGLANSRTRLVPCFTRNFSMMQSDVVVGHAQGVDRAAHVQSSGNVLGLPVLRFRLVNRPAKVRRRTGNLTRGVVAPRGQ